MSKLIKQLYVIAGSESKRITNMIICDVFKGMFEGVSLAAVMLLLLRVCEFLFSKRQIVTTDIVQLFLLIFVSLVGKILFGYFAERNKNIMSYKMGAENRLLIGDRLKKVNMGFFSSHRLGDISSGLTTVIGELETVDIIIIEVMLAGFIQTAIMMSFMFCFDVITGIIIAVTLVLGLLINAMFQKVADAKTTKLLKYKIALHADVLEFVKGIGVIKAFGKSKVALKKVEATIDENKNGFLATEKTIVPVNMLFLLIFRLGTCAIITSAILRYVSGTLSPDKTIMLIVSSFMVFGGIEMAGSMQSIKGVAVQNLNKVNELRNIPIMSEGTKKEIANSDIVFRNVDFSYKDNTAYEITSTHDENDASALFKNINCEIPAHKTTAIVGPSGSGKTTLCNLITRFWDVSGGSVLVGGSNVKEYCYDDLLSKFSMVFQNVYLFDDTIENNIKFGNPEASLDEVIEAAKQAQCHEFISALPEGYNTVLNEGGSNLSGGEKQRISIARALLKPSDFVILDEATSSIDPENEEKLLAALKELLKNKTAIIIAHKLGTIKSSDQIIVLCNGSIESIGTHSELIEKSAMYKKLIKEREVAESWRI